MNQDDILPVIVYTKQIINRMVFRIYIELNCVLSWSFVRWMLRKDCFVVRAVYLIFMIYYKSVFPYLYIFLKCDKLGIGIVIGILNFNINNFTIFTRTFMYYIFSDITHHYTYGRLETVIFIVNIFKSSEII